MIDSVITSDGPVAVPASVVQASTMLSNMNEDTDCTVVSIPNITTETLSRIVQWYQDPNPTLLHALTDVQLSHLIHASDFFDMSQLTDALITEYHRRIANLSLQEMRTFFGITDDFTTDTLIQHRYAFHWALM